MDAGAVRLVAKARPFVAFAGRWCENGVSDDVFLRVHFLLFVLLLAPLWATPGSLEHALRAQALLGPEVWSRVIVVKNERRDGPYPRTVHALVFELAGLLWFYTDVDGTQSFSLHVGNLEAEKADFAPLLRDIDPGFRRWSEYKPGGKPPPAARPDLPLRNGCFIESVVALRERLARGEAAANARLLSYYAETPTGRVGHTVLAYEVGDRLEIFDSAEPARGALFPKTAGADPLQLARALEGLDVVKARYVPLLSGDAFAGRVLPVALATPRHATACPGGGDLPGAGPGGAVHPRGGPPIQRTL